jgi:16S rRNA (cytosine1402-N4)-methyltransferase
LTSLDIEHVDGVLADLGVSSAQLDREERGFSLAKEGPIDMRMDPSEGETALELIGRSDEDELADVIYRYGEERRSRRIARSVRRAYEEGELHTTADLRRAVHRATGPRRGRIDPATKTFQALRIAVNEELTDLEALLDLVPSVLRTGGVVAVISFHSLEDRMVKRAFRDSEHLSPLTKRPIVASEQEQQDNPRSRSAKLRAARRVEVAA